MKIHLPNSAFLGNIDSFLRRFDSSGPDKLEITANKKWISIHPAVLAMTAALGLAVGPKNIHCEKLEAASKHYLERMGLFKLLGIKSKIEITEHEPAGRFIPLTKITNSQELSRFIADTIPLLHLKPEQAAPIKYILSELVRNVLEHAHAKNGAIVAAQYYKKSNTIRIGIADTGVGIRETISQSHSATTDLEAIKLALTPGITGTTRRLGGTEQNAGAGLFFIKSIAKVNRDFFLIYSGNAVYKLLKSKPGKIRLYADPFKDRHSAGEDFPFWQGTVVGIDINLDETKEFSLLLDLIRDIYIKTIKERRKEKYRRPRFI
ncbi:ATP-binding protein [Candidatus Woesearchaeota archaeon]|nr:ATP-binding protein [Candidatus Woesearchaeota archaeon]MBW3006396.1 ATP-binding protein [Candidatus Woesearchaeota archaeon]